jgi:hypothetical protein
VKTVESSVSFERDIRPLFRESDRRSMDFAFDLYDYEEVSENAQLILSRLETGSMPCDGGWPEETIALFRRWVQSGTPE